MTLMCDPQCINVGSHLHGTGQCRPCAWFWKAGSCCKGLQCEYCHLCPEGELRTRKQTKLASMRVESDFSKKCGLTDIPFGKKYSDATTCPTNSHKLIGFDDSDDEDEDEYSLAHYTDEIEVFQPPPGLQPPTAPPGNFSKSESSSVLHVTFACQSDVSTKQDSDDALSSIASCEEETSDGASVVELDDDDDDEDDSISAQEPMKVNNLSCAPPPGLNLPDCPPGSFGADNVSVGSSLHASGQCRPCAWYWKPGGCKNGSACRHCHTCPEGSVKALKRGKVALLKAGYSPYLPVLRSNHLISRG